MTSSGDDHQHTLLVTPAELLEGKAVTLLSSTADGHSHFVKITKADFTALNAGEVVRKKSCYEDDHEWALTCSYGTPAVGTPECSDECGDGTTRENACP